MNQQTINNNKLIAKFMRYEHNGKAMAAMAINYKTLYHKDWNWLMPVVKKIETIKVLWKASQFKKDRWTYHGKNQHWYFVRIEAAICDIYEGMSMVDQRRIEFPHNDPYFKNHKNTKIESTYQTVVEFIKWYNKKEK